MQPILPFSSEKATRGVPVLDVFDSINVQSSCEIVGQEIAGLWSNDNKFAIEFYQKTIEAHQLGYRDLAMKMSLYFDKQLKRYHDDKRSGSDPGLEPIQSAFAHNKVLKDGITRFMEILADKSAEFFYYLVSGTGTTGVFVGQRGLSSENARIDMRLTGVLDAFGNALVMRGMFPTGLANATITELGAADKPSNPSTFAWRVLLDPTEYFTHEQGETFYTSSHYLITYAK